MSTGSLLLSSAGNDNPAARTSTAYALISNLLGKTVRFLVVRFRHRASSLEFTQEGHHLFNDRRFVFDQRLDNSHMVSALGDEHCSRDVEALRLLDKVLGITFQHGEIALANDQKHGG